MLHKPTSTLSFLILFFLNSLSATEVPFGINLEENRDYSVVSMFSDIVKSSRGFKSYERPWEGNVTTDPQGWPLEDFGLVVFTENTSQEGLYEVSFMGKADVSLVASSGANIVSKTYDAKTKSTHLTIQLSKSTKQLMLKFKTENKGIKNLKIIASKFAKSNDKIFNPRFLELITPFKVLRYMDLLKTNNSEIINWNQRAKKEDPIQSLKGVAWEYLIELANQSHKDIWVNIPYLANDDYVINLANLLKTDLNKQSIIYLELSNEIWNGIFKAHHQNKEAALIEGKLPNRPLSINGTEVDLHREEVHRVVKRLYEVIQIFEKVFSKDTEFKKIRPVLAGQINNAALLSYQLEFMKKKYGDPKSIIFAIAGAPYFGLGKKAKNLPVLGKEDIFYLLKKNLLEQVENNFLKKEWDGAHYKSNYATLANYYGVKFIAYEGGPDTAGKNGLEAKLLAHRDNQMGDLLTEYLTKWYACGGDLFMYYNLSGRQTQHGSWGLYERLDEVTVKAASVLKVLSTPLEKLRKSTCK